MNLVIQAKNITKTYLFPSPTTVLNGINLELQAQQTIAIVGASGEGKTTLLQILGTLDTPSDGQLFIMQENALVSSTNEIRQSKIGFIFQLFHLLEDLTVLENVLLSAKIARKRFDNSSQAYKHALDLIDYVQMSHRTHHCAKYLSGGEKQRVAIARAFCNNPPIILADEPTGNLDHETSQVIKSLLFSSIQEFDKSLIVVTHDLDLAKRCDLSYTLEGGILK